MRSWLNQPSPTPLAAAALVALCGLVAAPAGALPAETALLPAPLPELEASPAGWESIDHGVWRLQSADGTIQQFYATGPDGMTWARKRMEQRAKELERAFLAGEGPTWDQVLEYREFLKSFAGDAGSPGGLLNESAESGGSCSPYLRYAFSSAGPISPSGGATASANAVFSSPPCTGCVGTYAYAQAGGSASSNWCPTYYYPYGTKDCGVDVYCSSSASKAGIENCYSYAEAIVTSSTGNEYHSSSNTECGYEPPPVICEREVSCIWGEDVSCISNNNECDNGPNWVQCDGVRFDCDCGQALQCPDGGPIIDCHGPVGTCSSGSDWVECGGDRTYCPEEECSGNGDACVTSADCNCTCGPPGQCMGGTCLCVD